MLRLNRLFRPPVRQLYSRLLSTSVCRCEAQKPVETSVPSQALIEYLRSKHYTVRPTHFWMENILSREIQKPVDSKEYSKERVFIEKTMIDSYMEEILPFKSSPSLLEEYIFVDGRIRTGKLLEDLDAMAGAIAYKHVDNGDPNAPPVTIVTASVDRLDLLLPDAVENYKLCGHVTYVGSSSMEVFLKAEIIPEGEVGETTQNAHPTIVEETGKLGPNTVLATRFTMVAIDSRTGKSTRINQLKTTSPAEERLFEFAKANKARKKRAADMSLSRTPPTPQERFAIHDIYLQYSKYRGSNEDSFITGGTPEEKPPLPANVVWMENTRIESNILMQPQDRNIHNNIFGGYLMRQAYELAYADAILFLKSKSAKLLAMDEVIFRKPVHIGTLLNLKSEIIYAEGAPHRSFQVRVVAEVIDIQKSIRETTNVFYFTMAANDENVNVRRILPKTYAETMLWLDGKRRRLQGVNARHMLLEELSDKDNTRQELQ